MQFSLIFTLLSSKSFWCFIFCTLKPCGPKNKDDTSVILKRKHIFSFIKVLQSNMIMSKWHIFQVLYFPDTQIGILISKRWKVAVWDNNVFVWRKHAFSFIKLEVKKKRMTLILSYYSKLNTYCRAFKWSLPHPL